MLDFTEFQELNNRRCKEGFGHNLDSWSLLEWGGATAGEIGEACNKAKKLMRFRDGIKGNKEYDTYDQLRLEMGKEIADGIVYGFLWVSAAGLNMEELIREVFNKKSEEIGSDIKV